MGWLDFLGKNNNAEAEMGFFDHIEELRWHIIRSLMAVIILTVFFFVKYDWLFEYVIFGPLRDDFPTYSALCKLAAITGIQDLCMHIGEMKLVNLELSGQFMTQMSTAFTSGIVVAFPYIFWEFWSFVKPGLHVSEIRKTRTIIFFVSLLFFIGIGFGYFVMTPFSVAFFKNYSLSEAHIVNSFTLDNYISTLTTTVLSCGLIFELPILVFFLSKFGIMTPKVMRDYRRHSYVVIVFLAAVITPQTDLISLSMITIPLILLYESSIGISGRVQAQRKKKNEEENKSYNHYSQD